MDMRKPVAAMYRQAVDIGQAKVRVESKEEISTGGSARFCTGLKEI
jgi:hypothetical protein